MVLVDHCSIVFIAVESQLRSTELKLIQSQTSQNETKQTLDGVVTTVWKTLTGSNILRKTTIKIKFKLNTGIAIHETVSPLRKLVGHMGSHSFTCHPTEATFRSRYSIRRPTEGSMLKSRPCARRGRANGRGQVRTWIPREGACARVRDACEANALTTRPRRHTTITYDIYIAIG